MTTTVDQHAALGGEFVRDPVPGGIEVAIRALDDYPQVAVVLTGPVPLRCATVAGRYPARVVEVGSDEPEMAIGIARGLALAGMRPVVHCAGPLLGRQSTQRLALLGEAGAAVVLVASGAPEDVGLLDALGGWTVHVPGHPEEADRLLLSALHGTGPVYLGLSSRSNRGPHPAGGLQPLRRGRSCVVLAVGPTLEPVLRATAGLDVTVLYTATVRPFDDITLRTAVLAADHPDVVLVEPYRTGASAHLVARTLVHVPHRLLALGAGAAEGDIADAVRRFLRHGTGDLARP
ncbi:transketolase [Streptomyces sp. NPDC055036]